jgi:hypothetical protein
MFDKSNSGEIDIKHVYEMLNEFEKRENDNWNADESKDEEVKEAPKKTVSKEAKQNANSKTPG